MALKNPKWYSGTDSLTEELPQCSNTNPKEPNCHSFLLYAYDGLPALNVGVPPVPAAHRGRKSELDPSMWSSRQLCAYMGVLGTERGSSVRAARASDCSPVSLELQGLSF